MRPDRGSSPRLALAVFGVAALAASPATAGTPARAQKRTIKVVDNYFAPKLVTVNRGSTITWTWPDDTGDVHDVKLTSAPKGVKPFQSDPGAAGLSYRRRLTVPGRYRILCTFHEADEMRMTVVVRRRR